VEEGKAGRSEVSAGPVAEHNARWSRRVSRLWFEQFSNDHHRLWDGQSFIGARTHKQVFRKKFVELFDGAGRDFLA
jgi:hypothetical protein